MAIFLIYLWSPLPMLLNYRVDGVPSLGWETTIAYLSIPIFLVISQFISMNLMQPKSDDPQQQQANVILKFLPFMIGWFALNVPAALGVYWVVNNVVTTASTLYVRNSIPTVEAVGGDGAGAAVMEATTVETFNRTPMNEKVVGFGRSSDEDVMTTITPVDAEIVESSDAPVAADGPDIPAAVSGKGKRGGSKKKKKRRKN